MNPILFSFLLIALVGLALASPTLRGETLSTFTGQQIPVRLVRALAHDSVKTASAAKIQETLFEIRDGSLFSGARLLVDIGRDTAFMPLAQDGITTRLVVNGEQAIRATPSVQIRRGKGFKFVEDVETGEVVHIFRDGINLKPVNAAKFPGVFVNTLKTNAALLEDLSLDAVSSSRQAGSCAAGNRRYVELAVAYDNSYCAMFSDSETVASASIQAMVNEVSEIFRDGTCIAIALVHIEAHCNDPSDPYASMSNLSGVAMESRAGHILDSFDDIWSTSRETVERDAAFLITGFEDGTNTAGIATMGAACRMSGDGWVEQSRVVTFAHELGHTLSAEHDTEGVMASGSFPGDRAYFSGRSIAEITNYVDSERASCLTGAKPTCDSSCPGNCVDGQCIARYTSGSGLVPCAPLGSSYKCVDSQEFGGQDYFYATDCAASFGYVQLEENDKDAFCCEVPRDSSEERVVPTSTQFIRFTLTWNGVPTVFEEYIQDVSLIETRTVIQSKMVSSCQSVGRSRVAPSVLVVEDIPLPSSSPDVLPMAPVEELESFAQPSPDVMEESPNPPRAQMTPVVMPPTIPIQSAPIMTYENGSCGASMMESETFSCVDTFVDPIMVKLDRFSNGLTASVTVQMVQRNGVFEAVLRAEDDVIIRESVGAFTAHDTLEFGEFDQMAGLGSNVGGLALEIDAFDVTKPEEMNTCCGQEIYLFVIMEVCKDGRCNDTGLQTRSMTIQCERPCEGTLGRSVIPFSKDMQCPMCSM